MDALAVAFGDNKNAPKGEDENPVGEENENDSKDGTLKINDITPQILEDNELKLKDRIAQCRAIIESLKIELKNEKSKLVPDSESPELPSGSDPIPTYSEMMPYTDAEDILASDVYSTCVSKLNCDENLVEYEKQLQNYQSTLNLAQIEKKNAIRKQMLAKAYRLKLLEVENQCNIELLRVKQSLQCLEPLQIIASRWQTTDLNYDLNKNELIPRFPELNVRSGNDINSYTKDCDYKASPDKSGTSGKED